MKEFPARWKGRVAQVKGKNEEMNWPWERYRTLFEMVKDAIFISTVEGKIINVNPSWLELFGYRSKKEVLELDLARDIYVNPEDRKRLLELLETEKFVKDYEIEAKRRDGTKIVVSISDQVIQDEKGRIVGYMGMIRDVTQTREYERRTEEALRKSEEQFRTLVTSAPIGLSIIAKDGAYEYVNPKFVEMFGYAPEDVPTGKKWFEKAYPDQTYRRKVIASWIEELKGEKVGETRPRVFTVTCKDGSEKEVFFRPVSLTDGRQLVTYEDITERKRAEEELKQSEERYRSLVEDINDGYFIVQDGRFVYSNQAFANLAGSSKDVILGGESQEFFPQQYLERLAKDDLKRKGDREQNEFEISRSGGENLVLEIRSRLIEYNGRPAIAGICKDITERKKAETTLEDKVVELERWYQLTVDREVKMTQLKARIQELESELKGRQNNETVDAGEK